MSNYNFVLGLPGLEQLNSEINWVTRSLKPRRFTINPIYHTITPKSQSRLPPKIDLVRFLSEIIYTQSLLLVKEKIFWLVADLLNFKIVGNTAGIFY